MSSLRALLLYSALTVPLTWPLAASLRVVDVGDSAFFAWVVGWEIHALRTAPSQLPHGNIFHPLRYALGMDEPVLGTTVLVAPLAAVTDDAVLLFNLARLLTFPLSGLATYWLARRLRCAELPALVAGLLFAFSPIRTDQLAHLSTLGTQWLPLVFLFLHRFTHDGHRRDAVLAGASFALAAWACGYHGVIALAVLPPGALILLWRRWQRLPGAVLGAAVAALGVLPLYLLHRAALAPLGYVRGSEETVLYSAGLQTFLATGPWNHVWGALTAPLRSRANNLFPGLVPMLLIAGAAWTLRRQRRAPGRDALALAVVAMAAVVLALGPEVRWLQHRLFPGPFALLREALPVFQMIRVPSRAGPFIALPVAVLAAKALTLLRHGSGPGAAAVGVLALVETLIAPLPLPSWTVVADTRQPVPPVYQWLAVQPPGTAVVELPMLEAGNLVQSPAHHESAYMVRGTHHWQRLVNGYAGIEPPRYVRIRDLAHRFPSAPLLEELRGIGVRYVVLHRNGYGPNRRARMERDLPAWAASLREVARWGPDTVFELVAPAPAPPP